MTDNEKYAFDLQGYIVVEGAISESELTTMNQWIDANLEVPTDKKTWRHGGLLSWGKPFCDLLDNARVLPYLREILGDTLRLDHDYAIFSTKSDDVLELHGGGTPYDPAQYYHAQNGRMYCGLTVVSYALVDVPLGMGGLAAIPGSHKSSYPCPPDIKFFRTQSPLVQFVPMKAGDAVIFTEALTHGTHPWKAEHERRSLFYKFSPGHMSWSKQYYVGTESRPGIEALADELTENQRILLDPPSVNQHRRVG